jgi:hypothetical protein
VPRYQFKARDLAPFSRLLASPMAKRVLAKAIPVKRIPAGKAARFVEVPSPGPIAVRSKATPDGVPLHEMLAVVKKRIPAVTTLALRRGRLVVGHTGADAKVGDAVRALLADARVVAELTRQPTKPNLTLTKLRQRVLDPSLGDAEWLKAFRAYTVATMSGVREPGDSGPILVPPDGDEA